MESDLKALSAINIFTSCARPQGGSQGGFAARRDTRTRAHERVHVPTTINIEIQICRWYKFACTRKKTDVQLSAEFENILQWAAW